MDAFWRKGYEATSLADLCACTGLHKGSLYQAFGSKHELFMKALHHYSEKEFREVAAVAFDHESPLANLRCMVHKVCRDHAGEQGCLMINSLVELAPHDGAVKGFLDGARQKRERFMTDMIAKAQDAGEISDSRPPERLARQLMVTMAGVAAAVKGFLPEDQAVETLDDVIDGWT
jgi:TetR/AcrR family transcriptional repressor of nem operon